MEIARAIFWNGSGACKIQCGVSHVYKPYIDDSLIPRVLSAMQKRPSLAGIKNNMFEYRTRRDVLALCLLSSEREAL